MSRAVLIKVKTDTREELKKIGRKGETYDEVIKRLIRFYIENGGLRDGREA